MVEYAAPTETTCRSFSYYAAALAVSAFTTGLMGGSMSGIAVIDLDEDRCGWAAGSSRASHGRTSLARDPRRPGLTGRTPLVTGH
jgi:hypothetical protein